MSPFIMSLFRKICEKWHSQCTNGFLHIVSYCNGRRREISHINDIDLIEKLPKIDKINEGLNLKM